MIQFAPRRENSHHKLPWEGHPAIKPWNYRVTACIPVMDFHEEVGLIIELLRQQTVPPYIVLVDTGSLPQNFEQMERHRAEDVEVHRLAFNGLLHPCDFPAIAMDLAMMSCRTPLMLTTHQDLFFRRRDVVEEMIPFAEKHHACGYHLTRRRFHRDIEGMIGHQCSMFDIRALDTIYATWSQRRLCTLFDLPDQRPDGRRTWFPDTELSINYMMREGGIQPYIIGQETFAERQVDHRLDHCRAINTYSLYHPDLRPMAEKWITAAKQEAQDRIELWQSDPPPKPRLSVITAVSRKENLTKVRESLSPLQDHCEIEWVCIADTRKVQVDELPGDSVKCGCVGDIAGSPQKNMGIERATGDWLWFLDDDNLCHPNFGRVLAHSLRQHPDAALFVFDQVWNDGTLRCIAREDLFQCHSVDQAQFVVRRSAVGNVRYPFQQYENDWAFLEQIRHLNKVFMRNACTLYNALDEGTQAKKAGGATS